MVEIKGLQKTTLLDYPGQVACIVFLAGCNFHCPFCQNSELVLDNQSLPTIPQKDFFKFLKERVGKLEGVVITGGEPTIQLDLPEFVKAIKGLGFLVKLDTNGTNPEMVAELIKQSLVDYVAMDYKGPFNKYSQYTNTTNTTNDVKKTMEILARSKIDFELRTTVVPTLHTREDLIEMAQEIKNLESKVYSLKSFKWYLQNFSPKKCLDPQFEKIKPYPKSFYDKILPELKRYMPKIEVRGL